MWPWHHRYNQNCGGRCVYSTHVPGIIWVCGWSVCDLGINVCLVRERCVCVCVCVCVCMCERARVRARARVHSTEWERVV